MGYDLFGLKRFCLYFLMLGASSGQVVQAQEVFFTVSPEHFGCLVKNRDVYLSDPRSNLLIPLTDCPNFPDRPLSILNSGTNNQVDVDSEFDSFIYVTKEQFRCLFPADADQRDEAVRLFPATCEVR
ncbi:hypothetical protein GS624_01110 [Ruegeria sp. HKCCD5849]|uniref:hypothetical protein n=1 Tax=unclassified Ruegeria TaxID=2625375 RepID=UPI00149099A4|nr:MULTISPECIES: hypothetical protein [unclassified Ruegeria]NOD45903.1 hypothetical protein [Ruegeria sp. HKCCD5849]NOD50797.1 hypothetical protein [Ruegeria sp. HKCCD5851]